MSNNYCILGILLSVWSALSHLILKQPYALNIIIIITNLKMWKLRLIDQLRNLLEFGQQRFLSLQDLTLNPYATLPPGYGGILLKWDWGKRKMDSSTYQYLPSIQYGPVLVLLLSIAKLDDLRNRRQIPFTGFQFLLITDLEFLWITDVFSPWSQYCYFYIYWCGRHGHGKK